MRSGIPSVLDDSSCPEWRLGMMTFMPYRELSDEDTQAIIAFLRSQEPVATAVPNPRPFVG